MAAMSARLAPPSVAAGMSCRPHSVAAPGQSLRLAMPRRVCVAASQYDGGHAYVCELCGVRTPSAAALRSHVHTYRHKQAIEAEKARRRAEAPEFAARAETSLGSLDTMNGWLKRLGHDEAETVSNARRELRGIHINIYDLVEKRFKPVFKTVPQLAEYSYRTGKIFPREEAKSHKELRVFLRQLDE
jgi:hypothetical protein